MTYTVELKEASSKDGTWTKYSTTKQLEEVLKGLKPGTVYLVRLTAANRQGASQPSKPREIETKDGTPPQPPSPKVANETAESITLSLEKIRLVKRWEDDDINVVPHLQFDGGTGDSLYITCSLK